MCMLRCSTFRNPVDPGLPEPPQTTSQRCQQPSTTFYLQNSSNCSGVTPGTFKPVKPSTTGPAQNHVEPLRSHEAAFLLAEVEGEDGLVHHLLGHHVVKDRVSEDLGQRRVPHPQNPIEAGHDEGSSRLVHRLTKLLVLDGHVVDLDEKREDESSQQYDQSGFLGYEGGVDLQCVSGHDPQHVT